MQTNLSKKVSLVRPSQDHDSQTIDRVLATLRLVDSPTEEAFDKYTRLVTQFFNVPVALVSFVEEDKDRQYFKSQIGLTGEWAKSRQTPLSHSFCQYVKRDNRPLIIENAALDARVCGNLAIPDLGVRAYLGVPVHAPDGKALGALCAVDTQVRTWDQADVDGMVDLAACVSDQIALRTALHRQPLTPVREPAPDPDPDGYRLCRQKRVKTNS